MIEATQAATSTALTSEPSSNLYSEEALTNASEQFQSALTNSQLCSSESGDSCMGTSILEGMQQLKIGYDEKVNAINDAVTVGQLTVQDVMKLQLEIAKLQMQEELMAKTASKTTQNVDTLLKSQ